VQSYNVCDVYRNVLFTQRYTVIYVVADVGPCLESFDGVPGYIPNNFNEGELRYGVTTVEGCQIACEADPFCIRFSYITDTSVVNYDSNRVCYLFNSRAPWFISHPAGRVYFRRKCVTFNVCAQPTTGKS